MRTKQKSRKILKLLAMSFAVVLLLWNCKKDEDIKNPDNQTFDISRIHKETKSASELFEDAILIKKLNSVKRNVINNAHQRLNNQFSIDTSSVIHIYYDNYNSYTFNLRKSILEQNKSYKLVIETNTLDSISRSKILTVSYNVSENKEIHRTITSQIIDLSASEINGLMTARTEIECYDELIFVDAHDCESGEHSPGEECAEGYTGYPAEYGYSYFGEVCETYEVGIEIFNTGTPYGPSSIGLNNELGSGIGSPYQAEFNNYMGWSFPNNAGSLLWMMKESNSQVASLLRSIHHNNTTGISVSEYGSLINQLIATGFNNNSWNQNTYFQMGLFLMNNNYSDEACQEMIDVLESLSTGELIGFTSSWDSRPCHRIVVEEASNVCSSITNYFQNYFAPDPYMHMVFMVVPASSMPSLDDSAVTKPPLGECVTRICFNENNLDIATDLATARVAIHEIVHSLLMIMMDNDDINDLPLSDAASEYANYLIDNNLNNGSTHHEIIATLVSKIAEALFQYAQDNNINIDLDYAKDLAWGGLQNTTAFNWYYSLTSNAEARARILFRIYCEDNNVTETDNYGNIYEPKGTVPNATAPCN